MKTILALSLALLAPAAWSAAPSPARADEAYDQCVAGVDSFSESVVCARNWVAREEAAAELAWRRAREATPASRRPALETEQQAWTAFRDSACRIYRADESDAVEQSEGYARCMAGVLSARTEQLRAIYAAFGDA